MPRKSTPVQIPLLSTNVPAMPPSYYSGDQPNTHLRAFVEQHRAAHPFDPDASYVVPAFTIPIDTTKATAIYNMHTYWSKKPHDAIRQYIRHYTQPGDLVLDPLCGSGGTALAALMEGRAAIAIDRSPAATFITKNYCTPIDVSVLQAAFADLKTAIDEEMHWLYTTRCDRCAGAAKTAYTVYSQVFQCPRCGTKVPLFDCIEIESETAEGKPKMVNVCPTCKERGYDEIIKSQSHKYGAVPVLVSYLCESGCKPVRSERRHNDRDATKREYFQRYDLGKIAEIEAKPIPHPYPRHKMMNIEDDSKPWGAEWREGRNFRSVAELFTKRNLWALAVIKASIATLDASPPIRDALLFTFTSILLKSSKMMAHNNDGIGRIQKGTYYLPQILHDVHVGHFLQEALGDMLAGYRATGVNSEPLIISTSDARILDIPTASVDYIFTDPPYADKVQYGELNFVWEAWLDFDTTWQDDEITVNEVRGKTQDDWTTMMRQVICESYRVLKPGRCISLCYHDTSEGTWALVQDLMAEAGFIAEQVEAVLYIDSKTKTTNQYFADKVTKRDLVINFRKPGLGEAAAVITINENDSVTTFRDKVQAIIRDYLTAQPGTTKDRIYDEVVSRMIRAGTMEPHNFDELLRQGADAAPDNPMRWFVREEDSATIDVAQTAKENAAARYIGMFLNEWLHKHPDVAGADYSTLWEKWIVYQGDKPRRLIWDWLPDYFYKTMEGTYRPPANDVENVAKEEGRALGINRQVKRYIAALEQGLTPPGEQPSDATLAGWLRHCKRAGLYEQGKALFEKGGLRLDRLSEEQVVEAQEDYDTCVKRLARDHVAALPKARPRRTPPPTLAQPTIWIEDAQ